MGTSKDGFGTADFGTRIVGCCTRLFSGCFFLLLAARQITGKFGAFFFLFIFASVNVACSSDLHVWFFHLDRLLYLRMLFVQIIC